MDTRRLRLRRPSWLTVLAATLACACTPRPASPKLPDIGLRAARPGAPWPDATPPCAIPVKGDVSLCAPGYSIFASAEGSAEIAIIDRPGWVRVTWSALPILGARRRAKIALARQGLALDGWADLEGRAFEIGRELDLIPGHLWAPRGTHVEIVGTTGAAVVVSLQTPFKTPRTVETLTSCDTLGPALHPAKEDRTRPASKAAARATQGRIDLRTAPSGPVLLSFDAWPDGRPFAWLSRRGGYDRIAGGQPVWAGHPEDGTILFDGWVSREQVTTVPPRDEDSDSGCDMLDSMDRCPGPRVRSETPFSVGSMPGGAKVGVVERGTEVEIGEARGAFIAFDLPSKSVIAPKGMKFWMLSAEVDRGCDAPEDDDGCPRCDP